MKKRTIVILLTMFCLISCKKKDVVIDNKTPKITKFLFAKADNLNLPEDVEGTIVGNEITVVLHGVDKSKLKATIITDATSINYHGEPLDFGSGVLISLFTESGKKIEYKIKAMFRDVYFANYEQQSSKNRAVYWKNGNKTMLTEPSNLNVSEVAFGISVSDGNVYVAGSSQDLSSLNAEAVYWKNGIKNQLHFAKTQSHIAQANMIKVVGNDVYVIGGVFYPRTTPYGLNAYFPTVWKNGVPTLLTDGTLTAGLTSVTVHNNDVYVTGYLQNPRLNENYRAVYWKNGQVVQLTDGNRIAVAQDLSIIGTDVHVVGTDDDRTVHWKNGVKKELSNGMAFAIKNNSEGPYIVGYTDLGKTVYWQNGKEIKSLAYKAFGLQLVGNDHYLFTADINSGTQKFYYYLNDQLTRTKVAEIDHVEANNNPNAIFIKDK